MTKAIFKCMFGMVLLAGTFSCKKNNITVDVDPLLAPEVAKFVRNPAIPTSGTVEYYIVQNPAPGTPFNIDIGVTTVSNTDRKVKIAYTSTNAVAGTDYTAPTEVTIPAGSSRGTLSIQGLYAAYPIGVRDLLRVKIVNGEGFINKGVYQDSFNLGIQRFCDVVLASLGGAYTRTFEGTYGPYTSSVLNVTSTSATSATARITNIYDSGITAYVVFDWSNPAAFSVTVPDQSTGLTSGGQDLRIRNNPATPSTFSSCYNTITMNFQMYTSAGIYDTWTSSMAK